MKESERTLATFRGLIRIASGPLLSGHVRSGKRDGPKPYRRCVRLCRKRDRIQVYHRHKITTFALVSAS